MQQGSRCGIRIGETQISDRCRTATFKPGLYSRQRQATGTMMTHEVVSHTALAKSARLPLFGGCCEWDSHRMTEGAFGPSLRTTARNPNY